MGRKRKQGRGARSEPLKPAPARVQALAWPAATWINLALLALVSVVLFREVFLHPTQILWGNDIRRVFSVYTLDQRRSILDLGRFPLWDSTMMGGLSAVGNATEIILSPFAWLFRLSALPLMIGVYFCAYVILGSWGAFLWARLKTGSSLGALLAGMSFACSGKTAGSIFAGHMDVLPTMLCAPWVFWACERILRHRTLGSAVVLGAVLALTATAGHLPMLYWNVFFAGAYVAICVLIGAAYQGWRSAIVPLRLCLVGGMVFLLGAMAWWLPIVRQTLLLSARAAKAGDDYGFATMCSPVPSDLLRMLWPFHGIGPPIPFASDPENHFFWETASYPGLVAIALALVALLVCWRHHDARILGGLSVLCLLLALGPHTPVHRLFYDLVPGVSLMRSPGRVLVYCNLFLSVLAAFGVAELLRRPPAKRWGLPAVAAALFFLTVMQSAPSSSAGGPATTNVLSTVILGTLALLGAGWAVDAVQSRVAAVALVLLCFIDLATVWSLHITAVTPEFMFPSNSIAHFLEERRQEIGPFRYYDPTEAVPQQLAARHGLETITGYDAGLYHHQIEAYHSLWPQGEPSSMVQLFMHSPKDIVCTPLLDAMNVRYVVAFEPELDGRFRKVFTSPPGEFAHERNVFERIDPLPRAFVVARGEGFRTDDPAQVCRRDLQASCAVHGEAIAGSAGFQPVPIASRRPGELQLDVTTMEPGVLVLSEGWHPDWVATDNGAAAEVRRANYGFLGVPLAAGIHRLRVWYSPWDFYLGCIVSALFWLLVGGAAAAHALRRHASLRAEARPSLQVDRGVPAIP